jgi:type III restriction enzyme
VSKIIFKVEFGAMTDIESKEQLLSGDSMVHSETASYHVEAAASDSVKYDLIGKIVAETGLTRAAVAKILRGIEKNVFGQFANNPEEFIIRAAAIINEQKATVIIQHITYDKLDSIYDTTIFTEPAMKGQLGVNAMEANKHLYNYILYDSTNEKNFVEKVDTSAEVAVYVKLPNGFYISTPVGKYNPDWAIAFHEGKVKHIYFVAETKGSMSSLQLRLIEDAKIQCAREHFKAISTDSVVYDVVDSYATLMDKVMR